MVDLPKIPRRLVTTEAPRSSVGADDYAALGRAQDRALSSVGGALRTIAEEQEFDAAKQAGETAVIRDSNNNLQVEKVPFLFRKSADAFEQVAHQRFMLEQDNAIRNKVHELRLKHAGNPEEFRLAGDEYRDALVGNIGDQRLANDTRLRTQQYLDEQYRGLTSAQQARSISGASDAIVLRQEQLGNELSALVLGGAAMDSPDVVNRLNEHRALMGQLVANPLYNVSAAKAAAATKALADRLQLQGFRRESRTLSESDNPISDMGERVETGGTLEPSEPSDEPSDESVTSAPAPAAPAGVPSRGGLSTIRTPSGKSVTVNAAAATAFSGFLSDLEAAGYKIDSIGGHSVRNIAGTNRLSKHAHGLAIDINPDRNPDTGRGGALVTDLPPNVGQLAAKWGLTWGGNWKNKKDAMHFEYAGPGTPVDNSGTARARRLADSVLTNPNLNLSDEKRQAYRRLMLQEIASVEAGRNEIIRTQLRIARMEERELKAEQEVNTTDLRIGVLEGKVTESDLIEQARRGKISDSQFSSLLTFQRGESAAVDDPDIAADLQLGLQEERFTARDVMEKKRHLTQATTTSLLKLADEVTRRDGIMARGDVKAEWKRIDETIGGDRDPFGLLKGVDRERMGRAHDEFRQRVKAGVEPLREIADSVLDRYRSDSSPASLQTLPRSRFWEGVRAGNRTELMQRHDEAHARLQRALPGLTREELRRELETLAQHRAIIEKMPERAR